MENSRKEQTIIYLCLFISIVGTLLIALSDEEIKHVKYLSKEMVGNTVVLHGTLDSVYQRKGILFMRINGYKAVSFTKVGTKLEKGMEVLAKGKVSVYKGAIELVVDEVTSI